MLPELRTLLGWLFAGRLALAVGVLLVAGLQWTRTPDVSFLLAIVVMIALVVTAWSAWRLFERALEPGRGFILAQAAVDVALVTAIVHVAGPRSPFAALYVILVAWYGVLVPIRLSVVAAVAATLAYLLDALLGQPEPPDASLWVQLIVFNVIFAVVAVLGARLREAGAQQRTLESELVRVRVEADDVLRAIRSGVISVEGRGRLVFINPMAERLLELDGPAHLGKLVIERVAARCPELGRALAQGLRGERLDRAEGQVVRSDGTRFPIGLSTTTFQPESSPSPTVTAIFTDLSESKALQELTLRAERLEAVAALSASLAHEIRNPLAAIRSSVEQLARGRQASDDDRILGQLIIRESERLNRILAEFLDFSRVRAGAAERVDLLALAKGVVRLVQEHPDTHPDAVLEVTGEGAVIEGDEDLLHRIVQNLVLNAVQVAAGPVHVTVTVGRAAAGRLPPGVRVEQPVTLEVADTGPGISAEVRGRLFQPFVTGRPGGTGLGLAIVQRAVAAHRGYVLVDSAPGAGTTFTIFLPSRWTAEDAA